MKFATSPRENTSFEFTSLDRKSLKPLMEKRRRARINKSLDELKALVLEAAADDSDDSCRRSKLEKADILEMTVRHLRKLQKQQIRNKVDTDERSPIAKSKYQEGFKQCLGEANRYLQAVDGLSNDTRMKMTNHLCSRLHENTSTSQLNQRDGNPLSIARLPNDLSLLQNNQVYTNTSKNGHTQSQLFLLPNDANPSTSQFGQLIVVPNDTILSRKDNSSPAMLFLPNQGIGCSSPCVKRESVWRPW